MTASIPHLFFTCICYSSKPIFVINATRVYSRVHTRRAFCNHVVGGRRVYRVISEEYPVLYLANTKAMNTSAF